MRHRASGTRSTGRSGDSAATAPMLSSRGIGARSIGVSALLAFRSSSRFSPRRPSPLKRVHIRVSLSGPTESAGPNRSRVAGISPSNRKAATSTFTTEVPARSTSSTPPVPLNFSATGTNAIEGIPGGGGGNKIEVAVAPSGAIGGTGGDIYVADNSNALQIYASSGAPLGEVSIGEETCGVAVDSAGHVFTGSYPNTLREFTPSANPVTLTINPANPGSSPTCATSTSTAPWGPSTAFNTPGGSKSWKGSAIPAPQQPIPLPAPRASTRRTTSCTRIAVTRWSNTTLPAALRNHVRQRPTLRIDRSCNR